MGGFIHTNVGNATVRANYASAAQVQDGVITYLTSVSGTDTITAVGAVGMTAYVTGQKFTFIAAGANTGAATININSIGAKAITKNGATALSAGDLASGAAIDVVYDGTQFQLVSPIVWSSTPAFPSGTKMSFNQTAAPTGWTKDTTAAINNSILRLVTGSVSSGGSVAFSTWNSSGTTGAYTLATTDIPSHTHSITAKNPGTSPYTGISAGGDPTAGTYSTSSAGGGGSHSHSLSNDIKYYDFIIASKD
jgi:hypothetical protein